jgi:hypothetical protein
MGNAFNKLGIKSAVSMREVEVLQGLSTGKTVVEVGSLLGYSTIQIARVAKRVLAIDPHDGYPYYNPTPTLPEFLRNIERWGVKGVVTPIVDKAQHVLPNIAGADVTFIDTTGFYRDTMFCLEHANTPVIACHDFGRNGCSDVQAAVIEFAKRRHLTIEVIDTLAILSGGRTATIET